MKRTKLKHKSKQLGTKIFNYYLVRSLIFDFLLFVGGLVFILKPKIGIRSGEIVFSILIIIAGIMAFFDYATAKIIRIFNFSLIYAIGSLVLGVLIIFNPFTLINIITVIFGIWLLITGMLKIRMGIYLYQFNEKSWSINLTIGILVSIIGILLIFNPFVEIYITQLVGIFLILYAVLDLTSNLLLKQRAKKIIDLIRNKAIK